MIAPTYFHSLYHHYAHHLCFSLLAEKKKNPYLLYHLLTTYFYISLFSFKESLFVTVITEYKNRIDKLLTETQKAHETDKERYKETLEGCLVIKQQAALCHVSYDVYLA